MNAYENYILQDFIEMIHNCLVDTSFPSNIPIDTLESFLNSNQSPIQTLEFIIINSEMRLFLRYMDTTIDDSDDRHEIQLKSCPRCKSVIRRSLRYGNVIKQQLHDIEQVKRKVREESDEVIKTKERLETSLKVLKATFNGEDEMKEWERLERRMSKRSKTSAVVTENQVTLMERFCAMSQKLKDNLFSVPRSQVSTKSRLEGTFMFPSFRLVHLS